MDRKGRVRRSVVGLLAALFAGCGGSPTEPTSLVWARRAGGVLYDHGYGIAVLSDDSVVVTGEFWAEVTFGPGATLMTAGGSDIFVARYNRDGVLAWAKSAGGADYERGNGIDVFSDDSVLVTGYFDGTATFGPGELKETILTSAGDHDIFIARYNVDGTLAWAKGVGGADVDADAGFGVAVLSDDSLVVTGQFAGSVTFGPATTLTSAGGSDIFVARYSDDGTLTWAKGVGGANDDWGRGVAVLSDDSVAVTGGFKGAATFGSGESNETSLTSAGYTDIFIARYDSDGTLAWARSAGGGFEWDWGHSVTTLSDDSSVVTGRFIEAATFGAGESNETNLTSAGEWDIFVARYDADGDLAWARGAGDVDYDSGHGVMALPDDSVAVTGFFTGTPTFGPGTTLTSAGGSDIFIARYNVDGTLAWARSAGGASSDEGHGVAVLSDGSPVVTGEFGGTATFGEGEPNEATLASAGDLAYSDIFVARYNPVPTTATPFGDGCGGVASGIMTLWLVLTIARRRVGHNGPR